MIALWFEAIREPLCLKYWSKIIVLLCYLNDVNGVNAMEYKHNLLKLKSCQLNFLLE